MPNRIEITTTIAETRAAIRAAQQAGKTIGFVPTMGALHEGHLSLVDASLASCDHTVVSIFVNPTQFAPHEDLEKYPRPLETDLKLLEERGCWLAFVPTVEEMYPAGSDTLVEVGAIAKPLEGHSRPTHFRGVATVVLKLFQIVPADRAFFGQKDYQQTLVIKQMVRDLSVPIQIEICPIVREPDGLAMSSRNAYLSTAERQQALALWRALQLAEQLHSEGHSDVASIVQKMQQLLDDQPEVEVEYLSFLEAGTVQPVTTLRQPTLVAIAARVGKTRLIDNHLIGS